MTTSGELLMQWCEMPTPWRNRRSNPLKIRSTASRTTRSCAIGAQEHVDTAGRHRELIRECIERRGGSTSTVKDVTMNLVGKFQAFTGVVAADEVLKNVIADYSFKHYQIACFNSLIAAAEEAADQDTKQACEGMLVADQKLADRLLPYISQVTNEYMRREVADVEAKR